ncbi:MAG: tetratricopeptide repeat protein [Bacteroidales bacterium]|jgi:tetratricopeptide (TPR) repeat protein
MKKFLTLVVVIAISMGATAQTMKVQSAYSDMKNKRLGYAVKNIEDAIVHEDTKKDAKTWHYAGLIYASLLDAAVDKENEKFFKKQKVKYTAEELAEKAKNALIRSIELEKETKTYEYVRTNQITLNNVIISQLDFALNVFNNKRFEESIPLFQDIVNSSLVVGKAADEVSLKAKFCIALAYDYTKQKEKAAETYRELVKSNSKEEAVYINLFVHNKQAKELDKAINVLKRGRVNLPNNHKIIALLSGAYQETGNKVESDKLVNELIEMAEKDTVPTEKSQIYVLAGDAKRDGGSLEEAIALYNKSLAIDDTQIEANFSLGVLYFNNAIDKLGEANNVPPTDRSGKYEALVAESKEKFKTAIPSFKKVLAKNPNHYPTLNALKTIYSRLEMKAEYQEVNAKIDAIIKASQAGTTN